MPLYRTLGPVSYLDGDVAVSIKGAGVVIGLTLEQADELVGLIEAVDAHHYLPNSPALGTPSGGNLGNCIGYPATQLVGQLPNAQLANDSITLAGTELELGGALTRDQLTGVNSNGIVKRSGANTYVPAVAGTDFQSPLQSPILNTLAAKTSNYTAAVSELVPVSASGGVITVTLPTAPADQSRVAVKKIDSSANAVNITAGGSDVINRAGVFTLSLLAQDQSAVLQYYAAGSTWYVVSSDVSISGVTTQIGTKVDKGSLVVNVKDYGATGNGSTDDTTAIQAAITASSAGATVLFPPGTYLISASIALLPSRKYIGAGHAHSNSVVIKQKNSSNITNAANLTGLLVANAWSTNAGSCDLPVRVENLTIDGNKANNGSSTACGIVLTNYRSWVVDCDIINTPKDGVRFTDTTANGSNIVGNSCVENRIVNCHIDNVGGDGVRNVSGNGNSNTDGYLIDCIISNVSGSGINLSRAAGWQVRSNHLYTIGVHGIVADKSYGVIVADNYVEDFGGQASAAAYYAGIALTQLDGRQSSVTGNYVGCYESSSGVGGYQYLVISSAFGAVDAHVNVTNNKLHGPASPTNKGIAFVYSSSGGGGVSVIRDDGNDFKSINSASYNDGSATVRSAQVTADAAALAATVTARQRVQLTDNCFARGQNYTTTTVGTYRAPYKVGVSGGDIQVGFGNWYTNGSPLIDTDPGTSVTFSAAFEDAANNVFQLTFGGQTSVVLPGGGFVLSDPLPIDVVQGDSVFVRVFHSAGTAYITRFAVGQLSSGGGFTATTNLTATGSGAVSSSNTLMFAPACIIGTPTGTARPKSVILQGDSITVGLSDGTYSGVDSGYASTFPGGGYLMRALTGSAGVISEAFSGDSVANFAAPLGHFRRGGLTKFGKYAVCTYGRNDLTGGRTAAQLQADLLTQAYRNIARGLMGTVVATLTPYTTSTDRWTTTTNQTVVSSGINTIRIAHNAWVRGGCPIVGGAAVAVGTSGALLAGQPGHPILGYMEVADVVESARDSGKWKVAIRSVTDAAWTASGFTITSATANFTSADLWRDVIVAGAGTAGADLKTQIAAINSTTSVTVTAAAVTTVSGATCVIGPYTSDGLHPTTMGNQLMAAAVQAPLLAMLA